MELKDLIFLLSSEEKNAFTAFLSERNRRKSIRNIDLFKAYLSNNEDKIKSEIGPNAFGVLKKRLKDALIDFLGQHRIWKERKEEVAIYQYMSIGKRLIEEGRGKSGYKFLKRAENLALEEEHWTYLNELYHIYIEFSNHPLSPKLDELMAKHQLNQSRFVQQENLNLAYALVKRKFMESEFEGAQQDMDSVIRDVYARFHISDEIGYGLKSLYQLIQIADIYGASTLNYHKADQFFSKHLKSIKVDLKANSSKIHYQFELFYSVANIYFRKRDFESCSLYLLSLEDLVDRIKGSNQKKSQLRFVMLKALNLNYSGHFKEALSELTKVGSSGDLSFILIQAMIHFQQGDLKRVKSLLAQAHHSDKYYILQKGVEMVMRKNMMEILLHYDLGDPDYVESRILSFKRRFAKELQQAKYGNVRLFLNLIAQINNNPDQIGSEEFIESVESTINWREAEEEDIFFISYYAWLKARMQNTNLYEQTLALI